MQGGWKDFYRYALGLFTFDTSSISSYSSLEFEKATEILRQDVIFAEWDNYWGGIFSSSTPNRTSLLKYILDDRKFTSSIQNGFEYAQ